MKVVSYYTDKQNRLFEIVRTNKSITFEKIHDTENTIYINTINVFKIIISILYIRNGDNQQI